jgi:hypothetical protein
VDVDDAFEEWSWAIRSIVDGGYRLAIRADFLGVGRGSGAETTIQDAGTAFRFSARGLATWQEWFVEQNGWHKALEAAGLHRQASVTRDRVRSSMDAASARRARILFWAAIALIVVAVAISGASETAADLLGLLSGLVVLAIARVYWEAQSVGGRLSIIWPVLMALIGLVVVATNLVRLL